MSNYELFKFRAINKNFIDSLVKGSLYFAHQEQLNDPFDCNLDVIKSIKNAASSLSGRRATNLNNLITPRSPLNNFQRELNKLEVCSFSRHMKETLMWSHYADNHKGVCVLYEFPESFLNDDTKFIGASGVTYNPNPLTSWFKKISNRMPATDQELMGNLLKLVLTSKEKAWKYEKEFRVITYRHGSIDIPQSYIKQIVFGMQASKSDIELITKITKAFPTPVDLYKVERGKHDFGVKYEII